MIMDLSVTPNGYVEVYNPEEKVRYFQCFYNLKSVVKGRGFFVILLKSGRIEVYDYKLTLVSYKVIRDIERVSTDRDLIRIRRHNGSVEFFDRKFQRMAS